MKIKLKQPKIVLAKRNKTEDPSVQYAGKGYLRVLNATKKQCFPEETIKNAKEPKVGFETIIMKIKEPQEPQGNLSKPYEL